MTKISLQNRSGYRIWLEEIAGGWYTLRTDKPEVLKYTHLIFDDDVNNIYAVDPPGGPYLYFGYIVEGDKRVIGIKHTSLGIFIRLE